MTNACRGRTLRSLAAAACVALTAASGCGDEAKPADDHPTLMPASGWPAPSQADGERACADVGDARACWGGSAGRCAGGVCLVPRPLPTDAPAVGWRCDGTGAARTCVPRRLGAGVFACDGERCLQPQPRLPDAAFWECIDDDGVVVCRGGEPASGVFPAEPHPGWLCGARRGETGERLCIDPSPDLPEGDARGWQCHFEHDGGERRTCTRDDGAPAVAAPCGAEDACGPGLTCAGGRCLPVRLEPECWLDRDCGEGRWCRFGTCLEAG